MNKEETLELISELKSNMTTLNKLDRIARAYHNESIPHNLDTKVLFQIELLHEKIGTILIHLYMGDLGDRLFRKEITQENYDTIINSTFAKYQYMNPSFLYNEKYIENFSVKDKEFIFNLGKGSCYYLLTGICSLDIPKNDIDNILKKEFDETKWLSENYDDFIKYISSKSNSILYCRNLADSIKKNGFNTAICIYHYKCNHYDFIDGQHRACISSKLSIPLPANVNDLTSEDYSCYYCEGKIKEERKLEFRKKINALEENKAKTLLQKFLVKLKIRKLPEESFEFSIPDNEDVLLKRL